MSNLPLSSLSFLRDNEEARYSFHFSRIDSSSSKKPTTSCNLFFGMAAYASATGVLTIFRRYCQSLATLRWFAEWTILTQYKIRTFVDPMVQNMAFSFGSHSLWINLWTHASFGQLRNAQIRPIYFSYGESVSRRAYESLIFRNQFDTA